MKVVFFLIVTLSRVFFGCKLLLGFNSGEISCAILVQISFLIPPLFIMAPLFGQAKRCRKNDCLTSYPVWALGHSAELYCVEYREYFFSLSGGGILQHRFVSGAISRCRVILVCFLISGALVLVDIVFAGKDCGF